MARIRSVHPGLFTDEGFVSCTSFARLLFIGLWTEADDQGVFEWKPLTLKMRLFPADNVTIETLLGELQDRGFLRSYDVDGREYGAIRNFRKFQRPKAPKEVHPIPPGLRRYVGLSPVISEIPDAEPPPVLPTEQMPPPMEEGGGRRNAVPDGTDAAASSGGLADMPLAQVALAGADPKAALFKHGLAWLAAETGKPPRSLKSLLGRWLKLSGNDDRAVYDLLAGAQAQRIADPVSWITAALSERGDGAPDVAAALARL